MEKYISLLQSNYGCISNEKYYSLTEKQHLLFEMDIATGKTKFLNYPALKNRLEGIFAFGEYLYLIDMAGKWIAEAGINGNSLKYYEMKFTNRSIDNFAFIVPFHSMIYMLMRHESVIRVFDTDNKSLTAIDIGFELGDSIIDSGCLKDGCMHIFSSGIKKRIVYDLEKRQIVDQKDIDLNERVIYSLIDEDNTYLLTGNGVYELNDKYQCIIKLEPDSKCTKICKCGDVLWILPGRGEKIFKYNLRIGELIEYKDYPADFCYRIPEGWGKFVGKAENEKDVYWCMRAANYIFKINKETGKEEWIRPYVDDRNALLDRVFLSQNGVIKEEVCDLKDYLEYVTSK